MGKDLYFSLKREYLHKQHEASNDTTLKKGHAGFSVQNYFYTDI